MTVSYPSDMSGISPANLIRNELHSVNEGKFHDYYFIVPNLSPFYVDNFSATITTGSNTRDMVEDVDYSFALPYVTGTRTTGKQMYGAVTLHNLELNGIISLTYQTVGGNQVVDRLEVLTRLADSAYNPRTTIFDIITNLPEAFTPVPHYQDYDSFFGQEELVNVLSEIRDAILQNSSLTREQLLNFLQTINSGALEAYVTKKGDTMTGPLTLNGPPLTNLQAATKQYVDQNTVKPTELANYMSNYHSADYIDTILATKVNKTGDVMSGSLTLPGNPIKALEAVPKQYVDDINTRVQQKISNLEQTVADLGTGHVTKEYVDSLFYELKSYVDGLSSVR